MEIRKINVEYMIFQLKAKMFEGGAEEVDETEKEAEKIRKESFQKAKGAFQDVVDSVGDTDEDNHDCESSEIESNEDADRNSDEEKLQRKLDFEAKQKLFNMN